MGNKFFNHQQNSMSISQPSLTLPNPRTGNPYVRRDFPNKNPIRKPIKGMSPLSFFPGRKNGPKASMTVEAAVVLPLFLFFFLNLLEILEVYRLQSTLLAAFRETGRELSIYAYAYREAAGEQEETEAAKLKAFLGDVAFSYLYVRERVESFAGEEYLDASPIKGGKAGIIYAESSVFRQRDIIELAAVYQVEPFIGIVGFQPAWFYSRYYGRAWTGYDVTPKESGKESEEEYVYITENAEVYHLSRECSHIRLSISECEAWELENLRNDYGDRYTPCELCVRFPSEKYYVGRNGGRYHQDLNCSGLKRTIIVILRSEAEKKYRLCTRCGG